MLFIKLLAIIIGFVCLIIVPFGILDVQADMNNLEIKETTVVEELDKESLDNYLSGSVLHQGMQTQENIDVMENGTSSIDVSLDKKQLEEVTYNPDNLRELSNLTKEQIFNILEGSNLQVLSDHYYEMEKKYNINAVFLMALNSEESGHGTSMLAHNNNNIGGVKTIDGGWAIFESWEDSLEFIASLIDTKYLTETGPYYNGLSIYDVNVRYCEGTQWALNLNAIANEFVDRVKN